MIGLLLALGIQGSLTASDSPCTDPTVPPPLFNDTSMFDQTTAIGGEDIVASLSEWEKQKYFYISIILNFFFLIGFFLLVIFVKEDLGKFRENYSDQKKQNFNRTCIQIDLVRASDAKKAEQSKDISILTEIKRMFTFGPFVLLCISTVASLCLIQVNTRI